jgi:hypothetical protein
MVLYFTHDLGPEREREREREREYVRSRLDKVGSSWKKRDGSKQQRNNNHNNLPTNSALLFNFLLRDPRQWFTFARVRTLFHHIPA